MILQLEYSLKLFVKTLQNFCFRVGFARNLLKRKADDASTSTTPISKSQKTLEKPLNFVGTRFITKKIENEGEDGEIEIIPE